MKSVTIRTVQKPLSGELSFPGDKSLSHRAVIFGSLAEGVSHFTNVLPGEDCVCTRKAFEAMGVRFEVVKGGTELTVHGVGLNGLKAPKSDLYCGNSGTSMRLLMGLLAGQPFKSVLTGDPSLSSRPMRRVADPLRQMGAKIDGKDNGNFAPITITGSPLQGFDHKLVVASAQVKSALLFAGLYAQGVTRVTEPVISRDHTENFLRYFGTILEKGGNTVSLKSGQKMTGREFPIAGDVSSAAFFMAMGLLIPNSTLHFKAILDNPTRTGVLEVIKRMISSQSLPSYQPHQAGSMAGPEPVTDFSLKGQSLTAFQIKKEELPSLIDEIPILCVLATQAKGKSVIHEADELRVKETDRIHSMVSQLSKMGAKIKADGNSIVIEGSTPLTGAVVDSFKDHRTAMSLIVAGMVAKGETTVQDIECINTSFPSFFELLKKIDVDIIIRH